jgi:hypothetical protein
MWAHYAEQAKGFVVIFDRLDRVFKGDETGSLNVTKLVDYTEYRDTLLRRVKRWAHSHPPAGPFPVVGVGVQQPAGGLNGEGL